MTPNIRRLNALLAVAENKTVVGAARALNITQPAVTKAVQEIEAHYGVSLFERTRAGMMPTDYGHVLIRRAKLIFAELEQANNEVRALREGTGGQISIGVLPYARIVLVPRAITRLLNEAPKATITIDDGDYDHLETDLHSGSLDLIVGTLRMPKKVSEDQVQEVLFHDELAVIARAGHPLSNHSGLQLKDLRDYLWVLPRQDSPQARYFEDLMLKRNVSWPDNKVYCDSLVATRGLLLEGDAITIVSCHRAFHQEQAGLLQTLPIRLAETRRPIGFARRKDAEVLPVMGRLLTHLRDVAREIAI